MHTIKLIIENTNEKVSLDVFFIWELNYIKIIDNSKSTEISEQMKKQKFLIYLI